LETYRAASKLYERTIDLGGHPNERAITSLLSQEEIEDSINFRLDFLVGNTMTLRLALKSTAQVGICSLKIFHNVFPQRFNILGISHDIELLESGL
jgi:bacterioferritin (cytochrome b1)